MVRLETFLWIGLAGVPNWHIKPTRIIIIPVIKKNLMGLDALSLVVGFAIVAGEGMLSPNA